VKVEGPTHKANPNSMLASLVKLECIDVDNTHPRPVCKLNLVEPVLDCDNIEDDLSQEPWNENPLPSKRFTK